MEQNQFAFRDHRSGEALPDRFLPDKTWASFRKERCDVCATIVAVSCRPKKLGPILGVRRLGGADQTQKRNRQQHNLVVHSKNSGFPKSVKESKLNDSVSFPLPLARARQRETKGVLSFATRTA